ncbi:MAG: purine-binding chemotaxis protein CheW [Bacteroidales bacterium]|jgi:purine-binding chemotaxis protein CheW|nr:purine-binding chemotaxis protein CheW [Bacteroidales bacterium]
MENFSGATPYLSFWLNDKLYAFNISDVVEVTDLPKITAIPQSPQYIKGVFNFRGEILPAIDVMDKCHIICNTDEADSAVIVLEINRDDADQHLTAGAIVERVSDVINIKPIDIVPIHNFDSQIDASLAEGVYNHDGKIVTILDTAKILALEPASPIGQDK